MTQDTTQLIEEINESLNTGDEARLSEALEKARALGFKPEITAELKSFDSGGQLTEHLKVNQDGTEEIIFRRA